MLEKVLILLKKDMSRPFLALEATHKKLNTLLDRLHKDKRKISHLERNFPICFEVGHKDIHNY